MTPAGEFLPRRQTMSWAARIAVAATLVAVVAGVVSIAALLLWLASILLPVAILAAVIAYAAFRLQLGRAGRQVGMPTGRW